MKITIIVPFFNIQYFDDTLRSLSVQTNKRFNVYVGNDNSPFSPDDLLNKYAETLNITYKKFENNLGHSDLTKHWSRCIDEVHTEWFIVLGDDDMLSKDSIEEFYKVIENHEFSNYSLLRFQTQIINSKNEEVSGIFKYQDLESSTRFLYKKSRNEVRSSLGEFVFKKKDYFKYGIRYYPKAFYSDNMMILEYSHFSYIKNIANAIAFIRITDNSLSGNTNKAIIANAAVLFYYDIVTQYYKKFNREELNMFYNYLINGIVANTLRLNLITFATLSFRDLGLLLTLRKLITLSKNRLLRGNKNNYES